MRYDAGDAEAVTIVLVSFVSMTLDMNVTNVVLSRHFVFGLCVVCGLCSTYGYAM